MNTRSKVKIMPNITSPKTTNSEKLNGKPANPAETFVQTNLLNYYYCKTCNVSYEGVSGDPKTDSFIRAHSKKYIKNSRPKNLPQDTAKIPQYKWHNCRHCTFRSLNLQQILIHEKYKHNDLSKQFECRKCLRDKMTQLEYRKHFCRREDLERKKALEKEAEPLLCKFCGYSARKREALKWHIQTLHIEHKFQCTTCDKKFITQPGLQKHISFHANPPPKRGKLFCDYCGRAFKVKRNLRNHITGVHMKLKDAVCSICNKSFAKRNSLRQHLLTHTGKRPYTCDICGKTFVQKPALTSHRKSHPGKLPPMSPVFIDSYIQEVDPTMVHHQQVVPVSKFKTQSFKNFQSEA